MFTSHKSANKLFETNSNRARGQLPHNKYPNLERYRRCSGGVAVAWSAQCDDHSSKYSSPCLLQHVTDILFKIYKHV